MIDATINNAHPVSFFYRAVKAAASTEMLEFEVTNYHNCSLRKIKTVKDNFKHQNYSAKLEGVYVLEKGSSHDILDKDHNSLQDIPSACRR